MPDDTETLLLHAAVTGDAQAFGHLIGPYRREILLYGYRMLGSLQDAEDLTQEVCLRAWTRLETFEGRASFRAWLYRIATNLSFDMLALRQRRSLPHLSGSPASPGEPMPAPNADPVWLDLLPDTLLVDAAGEPETAYVRRESVTLAFLVVLQALPPRQRAILLLRDVLEWHASEVADLLDLSVTAVESALARARATLRQQYHARGSEAVALSPRDATTQETLRRYIAAWEEANIPALVALLREDAILSMPPFPWWFRGREAIVAFFTPLLAGETDQAWRLRPVASNAQPAYISYQRTEQGIYRAQGISLLTIEDGRIATITSFLEPALCQRFNAPLEMSSAPYHG
ncbi:MAG TPA: RNA polymerase subunit sigma-70 [Ktedonobacterales bacterium]|nr:RNA polymerase subunit sigma-70 [Ktedonobacterales bacterium]